MNLLDFFTGGGNLVKDVGDAIDKTFTSDEERMEKHNELYKAEREFNYQGAKLVAQQNMGQMEVNKAEAQSAHFFVAGWRPAIGWVGALALFYQFIIYPLLEWIPGLVPPGPLDANLLWTIIAGMLGIGGMRSYDKMRGTDTKRVGMKQ